MNMEIFVKDFSGTALPRILKFGTNIIYDKLYCVSKIQPHIAYIPPVYEVYRGYIVFAFSVCLCVCNHFFRQRFLGNYLT